MFVKTPRKAPLANEGFKKKEALDKSPPLSHTWKLKVEMTIRAYGNLSVNVNHTWPQQSQEQIAENVEKTTIPRKSRCLDSSNQTLECHSGMTLRYPNSQERQTS